MLIWEDSLVVGVEVEMLTSEIDLEMKIIDVHHFQDTGRTMGDSLLKKISDTKDTETVQVLHQEDKRVVLTRLWLVILICASSGDPLEEINLLWIKIWDKVDHLEDFLLTERSSMTLTIDSEVIRLSIGIQTSVGFHHKMEINSDLIMKIRTCVSMEIIEVHNGEVPLNKGVQAGPWMLI